jgi:mRNA-degrading endonuclease RelE of RelBE toxin-antitoxin system
VATARPKKPARPGAPKASDAAPKRPRKPRAAAAAPAPALPDASGDAPLQELSRDALSVLLYVALLPEETRALVKDLGLSIPGFRTESLGDAERCDALADEIRAAPATRSRVLDALRRAFGRPPHVRMPYDATAADDLLAVGASDHGLALSLWRVLCDPDPKVRARATPLLDELVQEYYAPPPEGAAPAAAPRSDADAARQRAEAAEARVKGLEKELADAEARTASVRKKGDEQRDKLQEWLKEARARAAQAVDEAARARDAAAEAQRARERAEAALQAAQATDAAAEAHRARGALKELEGRAASLEARLARQAEREAELAAQLAAARAEAAATPDRAAAAPSQAEADEPEEAPASWLMPVYTREFYDSLEGWDRRIQRAAFKQANLLAQDHRHGSLRALPLEGLPGYYRVRVATDVRLLYRRGDKQNTIEILSLIDREDLDRYVRQAKTRQ